MGGAGSVKCSICQYGELHGDKQGPRALHSNDRQSNLESEKGSNKLLEITEMELFCKVVN